MNLLAVIPAYDEGKKIGEVVRKTLQYCDVLVIDDGSTDGTGKAAEKAGAHIITHERNMGKGNALMTGVAYALKNGYDQIITLDADGQHDPDEIPKFMEKADKYDIIIGTRTFSEMPPLRRISNAITTALLSLRTGQKVGDSQSGYRMIRTVTLEGIEFKTRGFILESEVLVRAKGRIGNVKVKTIYADEKSHVKNISETINFIKFFVRSLYDGKG